MLKRRLGPPLLTVLAVLALPALSAPAGAKPRAPKAAEGAEEGPETELDSWGEGGDDTAGFATATQQEQSETPESSAPSPFSLTGFARSQWGLWLERLRDNPFAKGRQSLDLQLRFGSEHFRAVASGHGEYDLAYRVERETYDRPTLDAYERLADVRETYFSATLDPVEFTFGRQIVPWGQGDVVSILDVTNPRDLREPGLADLDDLRLPVVMSRFGFFGGYHRVEIFLIHESSFGYRPAPLGEFSPIRGLIESEAPGVDARAIALGTNVFYDDGSKGFVFEKQQYAVSWSYKGPELDSALYVASVTDQFGVFTGLSGLAPGASLDNLPARLGVMLAHPRYLLLGYAGAVPYGDWLIKWEFGVSPSRSYNLQPPKGQGLVFLLDPQRFTRDATFAGAMVGLTYAGLPNTVLFFEGGQNTPLNGPVELLFAADAPVLALRSMHQLFGERLRIDLAFYAVGWSAEYGFLGRGELTYRLSDPFKLSLGAITYHPGKELGLLSGLARHDRLFGGLRWDFQVF